VFDYDKDGHIVGIELLDAKSQLPADALTATGLIARETMSRVPDWGLTCQSQGESCYNLGHGTSATNQHHH
jgi:hypothetical protein